VTPVCLSNLFTSQYLMQSKAKLCLFWSTTPRRQWGVEVKLYTVLISALGEVECSALNVIQFIVLSIGQDADWDREELVPLLGIVHLVQAVVTSHIAAWDASFHNTTTYYRVNWVLGEGKGHASFRATPVHQSFKTSLFSSALLETRSA
jgi:hypothetical protein